jgi:hypothetical protein
MALLTVNMTLGMGLAFFVFHFPNLLTGILYTVSGDRGVARP